MGEERSLQCPFCHGPLEIPADALQARRLTFRESCPHCHRDLHVCAGCKYYAPGRPNSCMIPGTDPISDREKNNFCDEFLLTDKSEKAPPTKTLEDIEKELFG